MTTKALAEDEKMFLLVLLKSNFILEKMCLGQIFSRFYQNTAVAVAVPLQGGFDCYLPCFVGQKIYDFSETKIPGLGVFNSQNEFVNGHEAWYVICRTH